MKRKNFDKDQSRVKLLVYMPNGQCKTFYSFIYEDKKGIERSIAGMKRRILAQYLNEDYTTAIFYDTETGRQLKKYVKGQLRYD
jgi:hypothetical protein